MPRPVLTITQVSRRLGVSTRTIRVYEDEGFITIERHRGRCLLGKEDVESIALIERLKSDLGVNLSGVGVILEMRRKMMEMQDRLDRMELEAERRIAEALADAKRKR